MSFRTILRSLVKVVSDEAERNPKFAEQLRNVFKSAVPASPSKMASAASRKGPKTGRPANRRPPAVLNPVMLARQGEEALRAELSILTLEQLRDIVADYGMDPGRLVMKWKTTNRVIDRIVEISIGRAHKGDVFRS